MYPHNPPGGGQVDQLAADLIEARLSFAQLRAIERKITSGSAFAAAVQETSDYESDIWQDMSGLRATLSDTQRSVIIALDDAACRLDWVVREQRP